MEEKISSVVQEVDIDFISSLLRYVALSVGHALLWLCVILVIYGVSVRVVKRFEKRGTLSDYLTLVLLKILRWIAFVVTFLAVIHAFGFLENVRTILVTTLGLVAVGFVAVWSILSNFLCSFMLMIARPFSIGDTIELPAQNLQGKVVNFNMLYTTLRDEDESLIQIPNNTFFQTPIRRKIGKATADLQDQLRETDNAE